MKKLFSLAILVLFFSGCINQVKQVQIEDQTIDATETLSKPIKKMDFKEASIAKKYYEQREDNDMIIKCAERMAKLASDQEETRKALFQLAQLNLDKGNLKNSKKHAKDYQILYPGSEEAQEAAYLELKASYLSMLAADRDQTDTKSTLTLAQNFKEKYNDSKYKDSIKDIESNCYTRLIDSEIGVVDTYLAKHNYTDRESCLMAAQNRIDYIKEKLLPYQLAHEPRIMSLEIKIAQASKKPETIEEKEKALESKYPLYAQREKASNMKKILRKF